MKKEIKELIEQGNWAGANRYINEHREEILEEDLRELEQIYREKIGSKELDEEELQKINAGTAFTTGYSSMPKTHNINWHCNDVSVHRECNDSVALSSWCWYDDACDIVYHHYGDDGWIGGISSDF